MMKKNRPGMNQDVTRLQLWGDVDPVVVQCDQVNLDDVAVMVVLVHYYLMD